MSSQIIPNDPSSTDPAFWHDIPIVDGHLDLAENVTLFGRDSTLPATEIRAAHQVTPWEATVSLPELERGGVAVVCATVTPGFLAADVGADFQPRSALYRSAGEAEAQALKQIALYEQWERAGRVRLIKSGRDLEDHIGLWQADRKPGLVLLMEGADPVVQVSDLNKWWQRGLRMIGLTYGDTRYGAGVAGGSRPPNPGGLTADGVALLDQMAELGFIWDIAHLAEAGVWQGLERGFPRVCASHANASILLPTPRHLSDAVMRALAARGGIIGLVLYNAFLDPRWREDKTIPVTLGDQFRRMAEYMAGVAGWEHIGIGSDLDGGFGREANPREIDTEADLYKIAAALPVEACVPVLSSNWLNFLRAALP